MEHTNNHQPKPTGFAVRFDYRIIIALLLLVILGMLFMWRPWVARANANDRTIEVTGQAKITAAPDEYVFYPTYDFKNSDRNAALSAMSKKSDEVVAKLKELGVPDGKIKTNSDGYDYPMLRDSGGVTTYTLRLTVTAGSKELAQKVQDYLMTTAPTGSVSPSATFSDARRDELEAEARDNATKDARDKANQSAKNLGFKIAGIKTISDGNGFGVSPMPAVMRGGVAMDTAMPEKTMLAVQPGENDLSYSVTVTYYIK